MRPSFASDSENVASCAAIAMSQAATRPTPPPNAAPCTRATVGFPIPASVASIVASAVASATFSAWPYAAIFFIQFKIGAGAKVPALAQQDDGAHRVIGVERGQLAGELRDQRRVERVVDVGPRERDHRHRVALFDDQRLVDRANRCRLARPARLRSLGGGGLRFRRRPGRCLGHRCSLVVGLVVGVGYIRNTPNVVGSAGRFCDAEIARPSTRRVSAGSMMPSSHSRALA